MSVSFFLYFFFAALPWRAWQVPLLGKKQKQSPSPDRPQPRAAGALVHPRPPFQRILVLVSPVGAVGLGLRLRLRRGVLVLARALIVKASPVLWIVRRFLPLSAVVEGSAPASGSRPQPPPPPHRRGGINCLANLMSIVRVVGGEQRASSAASLPSGGRPPGHGVY
jgi:hypothetical protein